MKKILFASFLSLTAAVHADVQTGPFSWAFPAGGVVFSSPATCESGRIYFGTDEGRVFALQPGAKDATEATIAWTFDGAADWIDSTPAVTPDGLVVVGSWDGKVYALDRADGSLRWSYQTGNYILSSPAVAATGEIIVGGGDGLLYAFSPAGDVLWAYVAEDAIDASPAIAGNTVYVGDSAGVFHAVALHDGSPRWTFQTDRVDGRENDILSSAAVGADGTVYFGCRNHRFYALSSQGVLLWSFEANEPIDSSPAITPAGRVVVGSREGYLFFFDTFGILERQVFVGDVFYASPAIDRDGRIYISAYAGEGFSHVLGLSAEGDYLWAFPAPGYNDSSPLVGLDGQLYVGMHDFNLYAFDLGQTGPEFSSWAAFRDNPRRSGRRTGYFGRPEVFRLFPAAQGAADDWYWLDGFGSGWFQGKNIPWIFHPEHGHLWVQTAGPEGIWVHDSGLGWLFTFRDAPRNFYYEANTRSWIFHAPPTSKVSEERWIFRYSTGAWEVAND